MVSYATIVYLVSIFAVMFTYTLLWDLYVGFWCIAITSGANVTILNYLYTGHQWIPAAFLLSATFWYLSAAQRRTV